MSRYEKSDSDPVVSLVNLLSIVLHYFSLLDDCDIPTKKINQVCSFLMTLLLLTEGLVASEDNVFSIRIQNCNGLL